MSLAKFAATQQVAFTASVREFLRQVVLRLVPEGDWSRIPIAAGNKDFNIKLTGALESVGENDSADEVRRKVMVVLIEEVSRLADYVRKACQAEIARRRVRFSRRTYSLASGCRARRREKTGCNP